MSLCRSGAAERSFTPGGFTERSFTGLLGTDLRLTLGSLLSSGSGRVASSKTTVLVAVSLVELLRPSSSGYWASALVCCASRRLRMPLSIRSCCLARLRLPLLLAPFFFLGAVVLMRSYPLSASGAGQPAATWLVRSNPQPTSWCGATRNQLEPWFGEPRAPLPCKVAQTYLFSACAKEGLRLQPSQCNCT